jgi:hypothetical protein
MEIFMLETLPISANSIVWNEDAILTKSHSFLTKKNNELKIYQALWDYSIGIDFYNPVAKTTARQFKAVAEDSRQEIEALDNAVIECLNQETAKDPQSEKNHELLNIYSVSHAALNYFTSVVNDTYYPTYFNQSIKDSFYLSVKAAYSTVVLTAAAYLAQELTRTQLPDIVYAPVKLSVAACVAATAFRILNQTLRVDQSVRRVEEVKALFEKALHPEKTAA